MTTRPTRPTARRGGLRFRTAAAVLCALAVLPAATAVALEEPPPPTTPAAEPSSDATPLPAEPSPPDGTPVPAVTPAATVTSPPGTTPVPDPDPVPSSSAPTSAPTPAPTEAKPDAIVTMGDSFLSGEGARWLGNAEGLKNFGGVPQALRDATDRVTASGLGLDKIYTADCRRSVAAEIVDATATHINIACSGTEAEQLSRAVGNSEAQLEQVRKLAVGHTVRTVVLSVGGDDVQLIKTMKACADAWQNNRYCSTDAAITTPVAERTRTVGDKVVKAVQAVREAVKESGVTPRIVVQSYPLPLATGDPTTTTAAHDENSWDRWSAYGCPFYNRDLSWLGTEAGPALNTEIKKAAQRAGADFVDLGRLLEGHQVCGKDPLQTSFAADGTIVRPTAARAEWARYLPRTRAGLPADEERELLHPNYYGQRALGRCLTLVVSKLPTTAAGSTARCVGAAGQAPDAVTVSYAD